MKRKTKDNRPIALAVGVGIIAAFIITIIGAVAATYAVSGGTTSQEAVKIIASVIWIVSSFAGCIIASKMAGKSVLPVCLLSALGYIALLAAIQVIFFDSGFSEIIMPVLIASAATLPVILWNRSASRGKRTNKHYRFR